MINPGRMVSTTDDYRNETIHARMPNALVKSALALAGVVVGRGCDIYKDR
jgi:hypothetical protein